MTRVALLLLLLGPVAALPGGCTGRPAEPGERTQQSAALAVPPPPSATPEPPAAPPPPATRGRGRAATPPPPAPEPPPPAPLRAPRPGEVYASPPPTEAQRDQAAIIAACRQQAERIIIERDRGQLLREDEQAARLGASASLNDFRFNSDRLGRVVARDRLVDDCVDANRPLPPRR